jgi:hypothetical protein
LGKTEAVFADDSNLTFNDEWFFALAEFYDQFRYLEPRAGNFHGFFEVNRGSHFDLAGRIRQGLDIANLTIIEAVFVDDGPGIQLFLDEYR